MLEYLASRDYIHQNKSANWWNDTNDSITLSLLPDGYARIDELQKNTANPGDTPHSRRSYKFVL